MDDLTSKYASRTHARSADEPTAGGLSCQDERREGVFNDPIVKGKVAAITAEFLVALYELSGPGGQPVDPRVVASHAWGRRRLDRAALGLLAAGQAFDHGWVLIHADGKASLSPEGRQFVESIGVQT